MCYAISFTNNTQILLKCYFKQWYVRNHLIISLKWIFFYFSPSKCISYYRWHFHWQLMGICVPFILPYSYRIPHPSHGLNEVPEPWWNLGSFSSCCCCQLLYIQWLFLIFLTILILRGLNFPHALHSLVFLGGCGSILNFLFSSKPVFSFISHS